MNMEVKIHPSWAAKLKTEFEQPYFVDLISFVKNEYNSKEIFPLGKNIFNAFEHCHYDNVKVVLIGQDPYHGPGQAHGLSFSVQEGVNYPPSLRNIYKEIESDIGVKSTTKGDLTPWADQGVLLLNAVLTVESGKAGSHANKGWEKFTDAVIKTISDDKENVVFILWGAYAQKKGSVIDTAKHLIIKSAHPSPLSAYNGFFGSKPFSKVNEYLIAKGKPPITLIIA
jgi:uracil-DNA glycosylase